MKRIALTVVGACCVVAGALVAAAFAGTAPSTPSAQKNAPTDDAVLPVLITVSDTGKVTNIQPPYRVRSKLRRLTRTTLDQLVSGPAHYHGHAVASRAVINLAVKTTSRGDGTYDVRLAYVSAVPVPSGQWVWVVPSVMTGGWLTLAPADSFQHRRQWSVGEWRSHLQPWSPKQHKWQRPANSHQPASGHNAPTNSHATGYFDAAPAMVTTPSVRNGSANTRARAPRVRAQPIRIVAPHTPQHASQPTAVPHRIH